MATWKYSLIETAPTGKKIVRMTMSFNRKITGGELTLAKSMIKRFI